MSTFGKGQSANAVRKLYTGAENFKVVAINPSKEDIEKIYNTQIEYTPEYLGKTTVTDDAGEREVDQIRLDFFLANESGDVTCKLQFYVADTFHKSQTGKYKAINLFGKSTWLTEDHIKAQSVPENMEWYRTDGLRVAKRGEVELVDAIVNLLNLPWDLKKLEDESDAYAQIPKEEWAKMFNGDFSFIRGIVSSTNNKIGCVLGVKTKADGGRVQTVYNRSTMRQYTLKSTKADRFKYILKDINESKANGAFGNVDFGSEDLVLREYIPNKSKATASDIDQTDMFAGDPVSTEATNDDDDWLN